MAVRDMVGCCASPPTARQRAPPREHPPRRTPSVDWETHEKFIPFRGGKPDVNA